MADFFDGITSITRIHKWYLDLAEYIKKITGGNSTAANLLKYYLSPNEQSSDVLKNTKCLTILDNGGNVYTTGTYVLSSEFLEKTKEQSNYFSVLQNKFIPVFFSERDKNKGILKRLKDDNNDTTFVMNWAESLGFPFVETGLILQKLNYYFDEISNNNDDILKKIPKKEQDKFDVFVGLHNYTVNAEIKMNVTYSNFSKAKVSNDNSIKLISYLGSIKSWKSIFIDYYDFNQEVGFTLPNPDYTGNKSSAGKIHPELKKVDFSQLNHSSLVKMITAGLAKPFYIYGECEEIDKRLLIKNKEIKK